MPVPNPDRAFVDIRKLRDYALSPNHESGRHKAVVFASALALGSEDAEWLRDQILTAARDGVFKPRGEVEHGPLYEMDLPVTTGAGTATVRTGWIVLRGEAFPRLTSCYVAS